MALLPFDHHNRHQFGVNVTIVGSDASEHVVAGFADDEAGVLVAVEGEAARVKDSRGLPLYSDQHPGLVICKSCYDMLRRVRAHDRYVDAELVPVVVIEWQQRHAGKNVSPTILERLLTSGVT